MKSNYINDFIPAGRLPYRRIFFWLFLFFIDCCGGQTVFAQTSIEWAKLYGDGAAPGEVVRSGDALYIVSLAIGANNDDNNIVFRKIDATTGAERLASVTVFTDPDGTGPIRTSLYRAIAEGNNLFILAQRTNGSQRDIHFMKVDATTGAVLFSDVVGGTGYNIAYNLIVNNGKVHVIGTTSTTDFPVTNGTVLSGGSDLVHIRYDIAGNTRDFAGYIGGSGDENEVYDLVADQGELLLLALTTGPGFNAANNSYLGGWDQIYARIDPNTGDVIHSTYIGGPGLEYPERGRPRLQVYNGEVFLALEAYSGNSITPTVGATWGGTPVAVLMKIHRNTGNVIFSRILGAIGNTGGVMGLIVRSDGAFVLCNREGSSNNTYEVTTGTSLSGSISARYAISKVDIATGSLLFGIELPDLGLNFSYRSDHHNYWDVEGNRIVAIGRFYNSAVSGYESHFIHICDPTGEMEMERKQVGTGDHFLADVSLSGNSLYVTSRVNNGKTISPSAPPYINTWEAGRVPTTDGSAVSPGVPYSTVKYHPYYVKYDLCTNGWNAGTDALSPATQNVCTNGMVGEIQGQRVIVPSSAMPLLYVNGVQSTQPELEAAYQWQEATAPGGPWTDIPGAIFQNFSPQPLVLTRYYRRIAHTGQCCGNTIISTSQTATVMVNGNMAPTVNAGGIYNTCPGVNVSLNSTISGGALPYSFDWDQGAADMEDPTVAPATRTIYTLIVTDGNGCRQVDQALVNPYSADAGPATASSCAGAPIQIGTAAIPGVPGIGYAWSPSTNLTCSNCAQPLASPAASTNYTLTLTIPVTGGGSCQTTDMITVNPVAPPANNGGQFAGPDVTVCIGGTANIGAAAEAGFTYTWAPGNYLAFNTWTPTIFQPGSLELPNPDPILYYLTAQKDGCIFVDEVYASVIEARAWIDGCGPRTIGEPDRTPNINETYEWVNLGGGTSTFTGPTNTPQTTVSETVGSNTTYELRVTYNGTTCTDQVVITPPCDCNVEIKVAAPFVCPSFGLNGGDVTLIANPIQSTTPSSSYIYTWTVVGGPSAGLNTYSGPVVKLTDNVNRIYRVTMTSSANPNFMCAQDIEVNIPAWALPVFNASDVNGCIGSSTPIGQPTVADYTYKWTPTSGLSSSTISMPTATISADITYTAEVTDTRSGCVITDDVYLDATGLLADAGPDRMVCDNGVITLGTPAIPGATYSWAPVAASWQNGTGPTSAQPEVLVAITTTFTVTITSNGGACVDTDEAIVTVGAPVTPFTLPDVSYCPSISPVTLGNDAPAGLASYSWSPAGLLATPNNRTTTVNTPLPASATTFTLFVTNIDGCEFSTTQRIVPSLVPPNPGSSAEMCLGESISIGDVSNPTGGGITYAWSGSTAGLAALSATSSPNPLFTPVTAGTYTFTLSKTEGGCTSSAQVDITVNSFTLPAISSPTICQGASVQIGTNPVTGADYYWSPSTGLSSTTASNPTVSGLTETTTYTLSATGANGCPATATVVVGVNPVTAPSVTIPSVTACLGDNGVTLEPVVIPAGTYQYSWAPQDGSLTDNYAAEPEVLLFALGSKNYSVTVTNLSDGCSSVGTTTLTVNLCPAASSCIATPTFAATGTPGTCSGPFSNNDAMIRLYTATEGTHYGISTRNAVTYDGPAFSGATDIPASLPAIIQTGLPNTGGAYIIRIYNGANDCYTDQTVTIAAVTCTCPPTACGSTTITKN